MGSLVQAGAAAYSAADAGVLVQLAAVAAGDLSGGSPVLPAGWSTLVTVPANPPPPAYAGGPQAILVTGNLPSAPQTTAVVLAVGMPWLTYLNTFVDGVLVMLPSDISAAGQIVAPFSIMYDQLRQGIWAALAQAGSNTLVVTGMGLGGPLAQLAALDLSPLNVRTKMPPTTAAPACYSFSSPAPGDPSLAAAITQAVPAAWCVLPAFLGTMIDRFGSIADVPGTTPAGTVQTFAAQYPSPDDPWIERSPWYYAGWLNQPVAPPPPAPTTISPTGTGFAPLLAASLAKLCGYTYGLAQSQGPQQPPSPYAYATSINYQNAVIAASFSGSGYAIAFRGETTFSDFGGIVANSQTAYAPFISGTVNLHAGAVQVYTAIRPALLSLIQAVPAGTPIALTGHDFGGALAVLAAADMLLNLPAMGAPTVYTFGAFPVGGPAFAPLVAGATIYAVGRPSDFMSQAFSQTVLFPVGTAIALGGTPAVDDPSAHAITGYYGLLNPQGG
jgi:hypothetical protein